jgi:hypothetical protein
MIMAIGTRVVAVSRDMTYATVALLEYLVMGASPIMSTIVMACFAKIGPFPFASGDGGLKSIDLSPYEVSIWSAVGLVAISTGQDIGPTFCIFIR